MNHHHHESSTGEDSSADPPHNNSKWAAKLLRECAVAISQNDSPRIHHLLWMLNELASPYGDCDQKLASYFLHALFCKVIHSGVRCYNTLSSVAHQYSFDSARKLILKFQEVSPWTTFGHVAANGAILEALEGESNLHIIDMSNTLCTQWPTLLEALATRNEETPRVKLTVVLSVSTAGANVMKEVRQRMEKFARLMGVPFELKVMTISGLGELTKEALLGNDEDEKEKALAINCVGALRRVEVQERAGVIRMFKSLNPRVLTLVEENADFTFTNHDFVKGFEECLSFFTLYFDMLEESFAATSNERLMLERECSRSIVRVLASEGESGSGESRERGKQWSERVKEEFCALPFSDDVLDDVKALLKRYRPGWSLSHSDHPGIYLNWKDQPVVWASAWKPYLP